MVDNSCLDWSGKYQINRTSAVDHQFVSPFCLPEAHPLTHPFSNWNGPFSIRRRCLAGKYSHEYVFDYIQEFMHNYRYLIDILILNRLYFPIRKIKFNITLNSDVYSRDQPKFVIGAFNEGHEGTGEVIGNQSIAQSITQSTISVGGYSR